MMRLVLSLFGYGLDLQVARIEEDEEALEEDDEGEDGGPTATTGVLVPGPDYIGFLPTPPTYVEEWGYEGE